MARSSVNMAKEVNSGRRGARSYYEKEGYRVGCKETVQDMTERFVLSAQILEYKLGREMPLGECEGEKQSCSCGQNQ